MKLARTLVLRLTMAPKSTKAGKKEANVTKKEEKQPQAINIDKNGDLAIKVLTSSVNLEARELQLETRSLNPRLNQCAASSSEF